jgi:hypothetical protein
MILFDLLCGNGHAFEGWFRDNAAYDSQVKGRKLVCPICNDTAVRKAVMAPRIGKGAARTAPVQATEASDPPAAAAEATPQAPAPQGAKASARQAAEQQARALRQQLVELRAKVEANCDYVGPRFAEEARRIHYGESGRRNIYGEASKEEAHALVEEGVEFATVPWVQRSDA